MGTTLKMGGTFKKMSGLSKKWAACRKNGRCEPIDK
jgi:hypothetical protein